MSRFTNKSRARLTLPFFLLILVACTLQSNNTICTELGCIDQTYIHFDLPFEPSLGYSVQLASEGYTANLGCNLLADGSDKNTLFDIDDSSPAPQPFGFCNSERIVLDQAIEGDLTMTLIAGGHPLILDSTQSPTSNNRFWPNGPDCEPVCRHISFEF
jgi:hypothetical protein